MSKILLEGIVTNHWKSKSTYPESEVVFLKVDIGGFTNIINEDYENGKIKRTAKKIKNYYNVDIHLPKYYGVKTGQKIKVILEN